MAMTPLRISSHSPSISLRSWMAPMIAMTPMAIAQMAMKISRMPAVSTGAKKAMRPAAMPRTPVIASHQRWPVVAAPLPMIAGAEREDAVGEGVGAPDQHQRQGGDAGPEEREHAEEHGGDAASSVSHQYSAIERSERAGGERRRCWSWRFSLCVTKRFGGAYTCSVRLEVSGEPQAGGAGDDEGGGGDAGGADALAEEEAGDRHAEEDRGLAQRGDDGDRGVGHRPEREAVGAEVAEAADEAEAPVAARRRRGRRGGGRGAPRRRGGGR